MVAVETRAADNTEEEEEAEAKEDEEERESGREGGKQAGKQAGRQGVAGCTGGDAEAVRLREGWWWSPEQCGKGENAVQKRRRRRRWNDDGGGRESATMVAMETPLTPKAGKRWQEGRAKGERERERVGE